MKVFVLIMLLTVNFAYADDSKLSEPAPFFLAVIVQDIDRSIEWYQQKLGLKVVNRVDLPARGFKQANLKRAGMQLELIQLNNQLLPKDILKGQPKKTKIAGLFKFGFAVKDLQQWHQHLSQQKVQFNGSIVKDNVSGKQMFLINDPDGNRIQIFER